MTHICCFFYEGYPNEIKKRTRKNRVPSIYMLDISKLEIKVNKIFVIILIN